MFQRLANHGREFEEHTRMHINEYANAGLRTMEVAYRQLADQETKVEAAAEHIEKDLILLGATAVEDKLQTGVCYKIIFGFMMSI